MTHQAFPAAVHGAGEGDTAPAPMGLASQQARGTLLMTQLLRLCHVRILFV